MIILTVVGGFYDNVMIVRNGGSVPRTWNKIVCG